MHTATRARSATQPGAICPSESLPERGSHRFQVIYRGTLRAAILVRFRGVAYGYLNQCVHMRRELDCEHPEVFDATGKWLRCTMHGVVYQPETGAAVSSLCAGQSLTAVKVQEREGWIRLADKRARLPEG